MTTSFEKDERGQRREAKPGPSEVIDNKSMAMGTLAKQEMNIRTWLQNRY